MQRESIVRSAQFTGWCRELRIALLSRDLPWAQVKSARGADLVPLFLAGCSPDLAAWKISRGGADAA